MKTLLVDDSHIIQKLTVTACRKLGYEIAVASSGEEALEQVRGVYFDAILMDIHMTGMNGIETTIKIRKLNPVESGLYIMVYTVDRSQIKLALKSGMNGIITKAPYSTQFMFEMQYLHQAITAQKATRESLSPATAGTLPTMRAKRVLTSPHIPARELARIRSATNKNGLSVLSL